MNVGEEFMAAVTNVSTSQEVIIANVQKVSN